MNHPATLTDDDLSTILDGCYTERMELVARIRQLSGNTRQFPNSTELLQMADTEQEQPR